MVWAPDSVCDCLQRHPSCCSSITLTTPGAPMATYKRAAAESCMTTSGSPGNVTLPSTAQLSRSSTTSAPLGVFRGFASAIIFIL